MTKKNKQNRKRKNKVQYKPKTHEKSTGPAKTA